MTSTTTTDDDPSARSGRPAGPASVVVGVDGSDTALRAVRWASREAAARGRALRIVLAYGGVDPSLVADAAIWRRYQQDVLDRARREADRAVTEARRAAPDLTITEELVDGPAAPALLDRAGDGLLVVGGRGAGGLGEPFAGSVASTVVVHAAGPVVVVRGDEPSDPAAPVVVGVDGSPASTAAIDFAVAAADAAGCPLVAVHTWWDALVGPELEPLLDWGAIENDEHRVLAEQLAGRSAAYPDVKVSTVVERSHPSKVMLRHAVGARLLVVGSRGRGGFAGLLLGSVSRAMVHRAPCPVAVVPPPGGPRHPLPGVDAHAASP